MEFILFCIVVWGVVNFFKSWNDQGTNSSSGNRYGSDSGRSSANMGQFEIRAKTEMRGKDNDIRVVAVECRGLLPVYRDMKIDFVTWAEDITENPDGDPIICNLEDFRHHDNPAFQCVRDGGSLSPNQGFVNWVEVGVAPLDALIFPKSGSRRMKIYCYMTEKTSPNLRKAIVGDTCSIQIVNNETGYKEWTVKRIEALVLSMRLGVAIAYADGKIGDSEASTIKKWLKERVGRLADDKQEDAKTKLNEELKKAFVVARSGNLDYTSACIELKGNSTKNAAYDAIELCTMVMAVDGEIKKNELDLLRRIANLLDVPSSELQSLRDKHTANAKVQTTSSGEHNDEMLIDLDTSLPAPQIKRKLLEAFGRYNDLLAIERDPVKRKRYQECIDAIARLRKKYG
jgi:uncharacterized tellurite resistance protein B-like protein